MQSIIFLWLCTFLIKVGIVLKKCDELAVDQCLLMFESFVNYVRCKNRDLCVLKKSVIVFCIMVLCWI